MWGSLATQLLTTVAMALSHDLTLSKFSSEGGKGKRMWKLKRGANPAMFRARSSRSTLAPEGHSQERLGSAHCGLAVNKAGSKERERGGWQGTARRALTGQGELRYQLNLRTLFLCRSLCALQDALP